MSLFIISDLYMSNNNCWLETTGKNQYFIFGITPSIYQVFKKNSSCECKTHDL